MMVGIEGMFTILGFVFGIFYCYWPLIVFAPLLWRKGNVPGEMALLWVFVVLVYWFAPIVTFPSSMEIIPEKLNAILFTLTGDILIGLTLVRQIRERQEQRLIK